MIRKAMAIITGTIDKLDSYRESTGYRRFFMLQWFERFEKETQHHELPVNAWNEQARQVKGDGYQDGDEVTILGKIKTHKGEVYIELIDIKRADETDTKKA